MEQLGLLFVLLMMGSAYIQVNWEHRVHLTEYINTSMEDYYYFQSSFISSGTRVSGVKIISIN